MDTSSLCPGSRGFQERSTDLFLSKTLKCNQFLDVRKSLPHENGKRLGLCKTEFDPSVQPLVIIRNKAFGIRVLEYPQDTIFYRIATLEEARQVSSVEGILRIKQYKQIRAIPLRGWPNR